MVTMIGMIMTKITTMAMMRTITMTIYSPQQLPLLAATVFESMMMTMMGILRLDHDDENNMLSW